VFQQGTEAPWGGVVIGGRLYPRPELADTLRSHLRDTLQRQRPGQYPDIEAALADPDRSRFYAHVEGEVFVDIAIFMDAWGIIAEYPANWLDDPGDIEAATDAAMKAVPIPDDASELAP